MSAPSPQIAVVAPSHNRALRLRWLLNSLEEQTLPRDRFEVIVGLRLRRRRPDRAAAARAPDRGRGALRFDPDPGTPTAPKLRNAGWRAATAPLVIFTDDDCRAPADWLENAVAAAAANPGRSSRG